MLNPLRIGQTGPFQNVNSFLMTCVSAGFRDLESLFMQGYVPDRNNAEGIVDLEKTAAV